MSLLFLMPLTALGSPACPHGGSVAPPGHSIVHDVHHLSWPPHDGKYICMWGSYETSTLCQGDFTETVDEYTVSILKKVGEKRRFHKRRFRKRRFHKRRFRKRRFRKSRFCKRRFRKRRFRTTNVDYTNVDSTNVDSTNVDSTNVSTTLWAQLSSRVDVWCVDLLYRICIL